MFDAKVEISGALQDGMKAVLAELRDADSMGGAVGRQLIETVGRLDADQNKTTFAREAAPGGASWVPLDPKYEKRKRKAVGGRKKLVWDGKMRASATTARGAARIARVAGDHMELGTSHALARKHQFGKRGIEYVKPHHRRLAVGRGYAQVRGHARRVNLPARPFIGKSPEQDGAIRQAITRVLTERLERASRGRLKATRLASARAAGRLIVVTR